MAYICRYMSPLGGMTMASDGEALTGLWFDGQKYFARGLQAPLEERELPVFLETGRWLDIYFRGNTPDFTPPLEMCASPFRRRVWSVLMTIPYGETMTYGGIAAGMEAEDGKRVSAQAVGGAVAHNSISLIIPCHRVLGSDGSLTGYAGGLEKKAWLLEMERNGKELQGNK